MGKVIFTQQTDRGVYNMIGGTVTYVADGQGEVKDKVVNIGLTLNTYNKEKKREEKQYLSVAFWNDEDPEKPQLADRVKRAKVRVGSFLFFRTGKITDTGRNANDGTPRLSAVGFDFQYNCKYEIPAEEGQRSYNILCGYARNVEQRGEYYQVSIPVERRINGDKETVWYAVSFANTEKNNIGTRASKVVQNGTPVCILTGSISDREGNNGTVYHNTRGFEFVSGFTQRADT